MCVAFLAASQDVLEPDLVKGRLHLANLAKRYGFHITEFSRNGFNILVVHHEKEYLNSEDHGLLRIQCAATNNYPSDWDRYLSISISADFVEVINDYAGSIPLFYSQRKGLILSNIEPCVYLASGSTFNDLSAENIYGFLRYSHYIWDETAWVHIKQMVPDAKYKFSLAGELLSTEYLRSVRANDAGANLTDKEVANGLFELNDLLVRRSLSNSDEIILPLSSGYDSRMIFSVLANDNKLREKTRCFTYGSEGSIEVEAGRRLSRLKGVEWHHIDLPCKFLDKRYLNDISNIFGASLHMHGMYQMEFYQQIIHQFDISPTACLTSGFMTGVPAGQHNGLLQINDTHCSLTAAMNRFSQSNVWRDEDLEKFPIFAGKCYLEKAEERFRSAFDRFDGEVFQQAVMFDVWTRQRNFISYYPRVFEWLLPVVSPHMCAEYANYFMSIKKEHLWNRKAVELMFLQHYPDIAKVASNSNGVAALGNNFETSMFLISRIISRFGIANPLPKRFHNTPIEFDLQAVVNCGEDSFYPLLQGSESVRGLLELFGGQDMFSDLYKKASSGNGNAYARAVSFQAIALNGLLDFASQDMGSI